MPIYEFECEWGHIYERIFSIAECPDKIECDCCDQRCIGKGVQYAHKIWSTPAKLVDSAPTVVFKNAKGEFYFPPTTDERPPAGYVREEYKGLQARQQLEREVQRETDTKHMLHEMAHDHQTELARKQRHDHLKANMSKITAASDNPSRAEAVIKGAMEYSKTRKRAKREKETSMLKVNV